MSEAPIPEATSASTEARHQALLEVAEAIAQHRDLAERLHRVVEFDYLNLILYDPKRNVMRLHILESERKFREYGPGSEFAIGETPSGWVWESQKPYLLDDIEKETRIPTIMQTLRENGVRSFCALALT